MLNTIQSTFDEAVDKNDFLQKLPEIFGPPPFESHYSFNSSLMDASDDNPWEFFSDDNDGLTIETGTEPSIEASSLSTSEVVCTVLAVIDEETDNTRPCRQTRIKRQHYTMLASSSVSPPDAASNTASSSIVNKDKYIPTSFKRRNREPVDVWTIRDMVTLLTIADIARIQLLPRVSLDDHKTSYDYIPKMRGDLLWGPIADMYAAVTRRLFGDEHYKTNHAHARDECIDQIYAVRYILTQHLIAFPTEPFHYNATTPTHQLIWSRLPKVTNPSSIGDKHARSMCRDRTMLRAILYAAYKLQLFHTVTFERIGLHVAQWHAFSSNMGDDQCAEYQAWMDDARRLAMDYLDKTKASPTVSLVVTSSIQVASSSLPSAVLAGEAMTTTTKPTLINMTLIKLPPVQQHATANMTAVNRHVIGLSNMPKLDINKYR